MLVVLHSVQAQLKFKISIHFSDYRIISRSTRKISTSVQTRAHALFKRPEKHVALINWPVHRRDIPEDELNSKSQRVPKHSAAA